MTVDLEKIRAICDRVAASLGLEIVDVEFRGGAGKQGRVLRIFIDRLPGKTVSAATDFATDSTEQIFGVTHEDCANISREVGVILDVEDAVLGEYLLEVSSPGLDRALSRASDFERFVGSRIKLMTREPIGVTEKSKGNRHFEGRLERFADGVLTLDVNAPKHKIQQKVKHKPAATQHVEIGLANVEKANLVPEI